MKLYSRLLIVFFSKFLRKKRQIWASEPHYEEVRSDARPWLMARWKAHIRLSIRVNWMFSLSITVLELWGETCTARLFSQRSTFLHTTFIWTGSSPINHSWLQKSRGTGLPGGKNHRSI